MQYVVSGGGTDIEDIHLPQFTFTGGAKLSPAGSENSLGTIIMIPPSIAHFAHWHKCWSWPQGIHTCFLKLFHIFTQNTNSNIDPVQKYWKKAATNIFTCFGQQRSRCQRQMEEFEIILNFFWEIVLLSLSFNIWFYSENKNRDYIQSLNSPLHWSVLKVSSNSTAEKVEAQQGQGTTKL